MHTDPIADMLTRIRNAQMAKRREVLIRRSNLKARIVEVLQKEGFISETREIDEKGKQFLKIVLKYHEGSSIISSLTRVSKPGRRVYVKFTEIPRSRGGLGTYIISTPQGLLSGEEARKKRLGGEVICEVY